MFRNSVKIGTLSLLLLQKNILPNTFLTMTKCRSNLTRICTKKFTPDPGPSRQEKLSLVSDTMQLSYTDLYAGILNFCIDALSSYNWIIPHFLSNLFNGPPGLLFFIDTARFKVWLNFVASVLGPHRSRTVQISIMVIYGHSPERILRTKNYFHPEISTL